MTAPLYIGAGKSILRHGGARQKRSSAHLTASQVRGLWSAGLHALALQRPLTRFVTVHWASFGLGDSEAMAATSRLLTYWRDWLRDRGVPWAVVWVRENDNGDSSKGSHLHVLVHVPVNAQLSFSRFTQSASVRAAQAAKRISGAVRSRAVGSIGMETRSPASYRANLARALRYLSKGMGQSSVPLVIHYTECLAPETVFELPSSELGGVVIGKRCGWSKSLTPSGKRSTSEHSNTGVDTWRTHH